MKKQILILLLLLLAGIFSAQLFGREFFADYGFLNEYHLQTFANTKLDWVALFWSVLWERGKLFLALAIIGITPLKRVLPLLIQCIFSYTIGFFGAVCVMNLGIAGIGVMLLSLLPHGIFYVLVLVLLLGMGQSVIYHEKGYVLRRVFAIAVLCVLLTAGCLLESTVSTFLLQAVLKKIV